MTIEANHPSMLNCHVLTTIILKNTFTLRLFILPLCHILFTFSFREKLGRCERKTMATNEKTSHSSVSR